MDVLQLPRSESLSSPWFDLLNSLLSVDKLQDFVSSVLIVWTTGFLPVTFVSWGICKHITACLSVCFIVQGKIIQQTSFLITGVFHSLYPCSFWKPEFWPTTLRPLVVGFGLVLEIKHQIAACKLTLQEKHPTSAHNCGHCVTGWGWISNGERLKELWGNTWFAKAHSCTKVWLRAGDNCFVLFFFNTYYPK